MTQEEEKVPETAMMEGSPSDGIQELSFDDKLVLLTASMGYDFEIAQNALEAAGGDIELAIEIIMGDETKQCNEENTQRLLEQLRIEADDEQQNQNQRSVQQQQQQRSVVGGTNAGTAAATSGGDQPKFSHVGKTPKEVLDQIGRAHV